MLPILEVGPLQIRTASLLYALAVLVAGTFYLRRLRARRFQSGPTANALVWIVLVGALSANLGGAMSLGYEMATGEIFPVPLKSVSMPAALIGGTLTAWLICRHHQLDFWWACDQAIPALPLGLAMAQFGCLAHGCCYGRPTDSWLALDLPDSYGYWTPRYPTHLISAAVYFAILGILLFVDRWVGGKPGEQGSQDNKPLPPGSLSILFLVLYLSFRLTVDFIRGDALPAWIGPLNTTQVACAVGLGLVTIAAIQQFRLRRV